MSYAMGIDIGTTGIKAGLVNLATLSLEGLASSEMGDALELRSENLWLQTKHTIQAALDLAGNPESVVAIGIAGQMHGAVFYDRQGQVIEPILTWRDRARCSAEVLEAVQAVVARRGYQDLGTSIACGYTGAILLWMKQHQPGIFRKIARFSLISDFVRGRLLGASDACTDPTNAFGTGLFNVRENQWHTGLIEALGLDIRIFPEVRPSFAQAGVLSRALAEELGLAQLPIIYGGGDNQVGMVGSGLCSADSPVLLNIGTAAQISKIVPTYQAIPGMDTRSFFLDQYALVGTSLGGGGSYQGLRDEIRRQEGRPVDYAELDQRAAQTPPGADGLIFCTGPSRKPSSRKAGFRGNMAHIRDTGQQARAVMEGVLMDLYEHYATLGRYDQNTWMTGGGKGLQESSIWPQIAADLFGKPIRVTQSENVILGAAVLAAFGTGYLKGFEVAAKIKPYKEVRPDPRSADFYQREFLEYYHSQVQETALTY